MKVRSVSQQAGAPAISGLPVAAQSLFEQLCAAPSQSERRHIYEHLAGYLSAFAQHDIPRAAAAQLNAALARYDLPAVRTPISATQAAFATLSAKAERGIDSDFSAHTGRFEPASDARVAARHRFIDDLRARVTSFGASLTREELSDAARILELGLRRA
jgi:hypothetical protein